MDYQSGVESPVWFWLLSTVVGVLELDLELELDWELELEEELFDEVEGFRVELAVAEGDDGAT